MIFSDWTSKWGYLLLPAICIFGFLNNLINIIVFLNSKMKDISFKYLLAISISDLLAHRIKEHLNPKKDSAIQTHLQEHPTHVFDPDNIEILDKATSNFKIRLKEELHIITHKPELNSQHAAAYKRKHNKDMFKSNIKTLIISQSS